MPMLSTTLIEVISSGVNFELTTPVTVICPALLLSRGGAALFVAPDLQPSTSITTDPNTNSAVPRFDDFWNIQFLLQRVVSASQTRRVFSTARRQRDRSRSQL